jgi:FkbM family methyltransferase
MHLVNILSRKMWLVNNGDIWTLPNGAKFCCSQYPWDCIQNLLVSENDFFERDILEELKKYIPQNAVILDIGANIGNHSIFWAGVMNASKIHCFEPVQNTYSMLLKNIELNELQHIVIPHNIGLGRVSSTAQISVQYPGNLGATSIKATTDVQSKFGMKIEALDDIDLGLDRIDFVKIDVEGFELETLAGMRKTIEKYRPTVFVEAFDKECRVKLPKGFTYSAPAVREFFHNLGYKKPIFFEPYNWLFVPNEGSPNNK